MQVKNVHFKAKEMVCFKFWFHYFLLIERRLHSHKSDNKTHYTSLQDTEF